MILNILISTIDQGIDKICDILLPYREDVKYIVSHQYRDVKFLAIPKELIRDDVIVTQIPGKGLTKSRNNAIKIATGDICLIADDDVRYTNKHIDTIFEVYKKHDIDLACFKIDTGEGSPEYKEYPTYEKPITSKYSHYISSIEITFRLKPIRENNILFDERFGMGSGLKGGGEILFIHDALKAGNTIRYFPHYIVKHPYESTIKTFPKYAKRRIKVQGAYDARVYGIISIFKAFWHTVILFKDLIRNKKNPFSYLFQRLSGVFYILKSNKI